MSSSTPYDTTSHYLRHLAFYFCTFLYHIFVPYFCFCTFLHLLHTFAFLHTSLAFGFGKTGDHHGIQRPKRSRTYTALFAYSLPFSGHIPICIYLLV